VLLWPDSFLFLHGRFEEMVRGFWRSSSELIGFSLFGDEAKIVVDLAYYAGLFPGFAFRGVLGSRFVRFPTSLGKDPAASSGGLDEEHVVLIGGERNYAGDESLALRAVSCGRISLWSRLYTRILEKEEREVKGIFECMSGGLVSTYAG
jgi:hypothetical protein